MNSYIVAIYLREAILKISHNLWFYGELTVIIEKFLIVWSSVNFSWVRRCSRNRLNSCVETVETIIKWAATSENRSSGFPTRSHTNRATQLLNMARGLEFPIHEVERLYYLCSENKGADQLCGYRTTDLHLCFRICKIPVFSRRGSNVVFYNTFHLHTLF